MDHDDSRIHAEEEYATPFQDEYISFRSEIKKMTPHRVLVAVRVILVLLPRMQHPLWGGSWVFGLMSELIALLSKLESSSPQLSPVPSIPCRRFSALADFEKKAVR